jgi:MtN3 and saliva related transmembrane protein
MEVKVDFISILGFVAGALTTAAYFPQVIRTWRSKSSKDISLPMIALMASGVFLWFLYGLLTQSIPIIAANLVSFVLVLGVLILAVRYR